jgi:hypothetical protein
VNSRYYLTYQSTFSAEKPKKLAKTSLTDRANVKILGFDYVYISTLCAERRNLLYLFLYFFGKGRNGLRRVVRDYLGFVNCFWMGS